MSQQRSYIHGFTAEERDRLSRQAVSLAPYVFGQIDFSGCRRVIEIGCGVGAQMKLLLKRWPDLRITGIDREASQIAGAQCFMAEEIGKGKASFHVGEGARLPFSNDHFDGAFLCWMLEHVAEPLEILRELRRVLKPGAVLYDTEVFNSGLYTDPACPAMHRYWAAFNADQRRLGGDPDVGMKLNNLARRAGFTTSELYSVSAHLDRRITDLAARRAFLDYWHELLLTAAPALQEQGAVSQPLIDDMGLEFAALRDHLDSVFVYMLYQLRAVCP